MLIDMVGSNGKWLVMNEYAMCFWQLVGVGLGGGMLIWSRALIGE